MDKFKFVGMIPVYVPDDKTDDISDGYHTFKELYRYRMLYNAAFFNLLYATGKVRVTKSRFHSDGEPCFGGGWFVVQAELPTGQVSNHYEEKYWDLFKVMEVEKADSWDGHTPQLAADRIERFVKGFDYEPLINIAKQKIL